MFWQGVARKRKSTEGHQKRSKCTSIKNGLKHFLKGAKISPGSGTDVLERLQALKLPCILCFMIKWSLQLLLNNSRTHKSGANKAIQSWSPARPGDYWNGEPDKTDLLSPTNSSDWWIFIRGQETKVRALKREERSAQEKMHNMCQQIILHRWLLILKLDQSPLSECPCVFLLVLVWRWCSVPFTR